MNFREIMQQLKEYGTEQNRKVYARHGVGKKMYGVSYANLGKLRKTIKSDHALALKLWNSGNHDARILATMIADPAQSTSSLLEEWVKDLDNYVLTDAFSGYVASTPIASKKMAKWTKSGKEWVGRSGWLVMSQLIRTDEKLGKAELESYLDIIEKHIHASKNRVRDAMNTALISMGIYRPDMHKKVLTAAKRIGKVEVDHGETGCKTPEAEPYIRKALERAQVQKRKK